MQDIKRGRIITFLVLALLLIPVVYAGWFEGLLRITGWGTSDTAEPEIEIQNGTPIILAIYVPTVTLTEAASANVEMSFIVDDLNGIGDLVNESTNATFYKAGETTRSNGTATTAPYCVAVVEGNNETSSNYTCTIEMWYWDASGSWTAEVQAGDSGFNTSDTTSFTVNTLSAMNMTPTTLFWPVVYLGDTDKLCDNDPVTVTNTGNQDVTAINVEAIDLAGESDTDYWIVAENFTVNTADACEGTLMVNDTVTPVSGASITHGPASTDLLYVCLEEVNSTLYAQNYSTSGAIEDWTVSITA